ncbi:hypothetical protein NE237_020584 [Protea cynaroides]|uniref:BHLH domain-containing protein n=1 Tax=Protea cynaroides TaxID=273540 RepID=A0A9Q0H7H8_9MAGN|nr:hypothetical protein NE237_020584 [Protea cynaroides]
MNKMRKNDQFRDVKRGKEKKRKKCQSTNEKEDIEKTPTPYVHVRARRGQATDSHSLAERARREKINKKMKQLQALVPGCDEINSKALVLDAIINYMKSIQSQVEFLSGKLALMNSMSYGFGWGLDIDDIMKLNTLAFCPIQPTVLPQDATTFITTNNYPILDSSTVCESQLQQGLSPFFFFQVYA